MRIPSQRSAVPWEIRLPCDLTLACGDHPGHWRPVVYDSGAGVPVGTGNTGFALVLDEWKQLNTFWPSFNTGTYCVPLATMYATQYGGAWPLWPPTAQFTGAVNPPAVKEVRALVSLITLAQVRLLPAAFTPCTNRAADSQPWMANSL